MLARIRAQAAAGIDVSQHAVDEMDAEAITLDAVREALATAILLEDYPTHRARALLSALWRYGGGAASCTSSAPRPAHGSSSSPSTNRSPRNGRTRPRGGHDHDV